MTKSITAALAAISLSGCLSFAGNCDCYHDRDSKCRLCGYRAAECKPGGREPLFCPPSPCQPKKILLEKKIKKNQGSVHRGRKENNQRR